MEKIRWKTISDKWEKEIPCREHYIINGGYNEQYVQKAYIESYINRIIALRYGAYDFELNFYEFVSMVTKKNYLFYKKLNKLFYKKDMTYSIHSHDIQKLMNSYLLPLI